MKINKDKTQAMLFSRKSRTAISSRSEIGFTWEEEMRTGEQENRR